jgi:hypothetical protein
MGRDLRTSLLALLRGRVCPPAETIEVGLRAPRSHPIRAFPRFGEGLGEILKGRQGL